VHAAPAALPGHTCRIQQSNACAHEQTVDGQKKLVKVEIIGNAASDGDDESQRSENSFFREAKANPLLQGHQVRQYPTLLQHVPPHVIIRCVNTPPSANMFPRM
jgi:hypothetical protein